MTRRGHGCGIGVMLLCLTTLATTSGCVATGFRRPDYAQRFDDSSLPVQTSVRPNLLDEEILEIGAKKTLHAREFFQLADRLNPKIVAAREQIGVAVGELWQTELLPNPQVAIQAATIPISGFSLRNSERSIAIFQPLIIGGRRQAAIAAASASRLRDIKRLDAVRRRVFGQIQERIYEIQYLAESKNLLDDLLTLASQTLKVATNRFQERAAPETEKLKAQVETERLKISRRRRNHEGQAALSRLESLVGVKITASQVVGTLPTSQPEIEFETLWQAIHENHPLILAAQRSIEIASHEVDRAKAERIPDVRLRLAYGQDRETNDSFVEAGLKFPLPLYNRNQGKIMAAKHRLTIARQGAIAVKADLRAKLARYYASYTAAADQVGSLTKKILPAATRSLSQTRDGYQAGRQSFIEILDAQRTLNEARLAILDGRRDWCMAAAKILSLIGREN